MKTAIAWVAILGLSAAVACDDKAAESAATPSPSATPEPKAAEPAAAGGLANAVSAKAAEVREQPEAKAEAPMRDPVAVDAVPLASGDVLVTVNGVELSKGDFDALFGLKVKKYTDRGREVPQSAERRYRRSLLERLTYHEVIGQEAARRKVSYDKSALARRQTQQRKGIRDWDKHLERRGETEQSLSDMYVTELLEIALLEAAGGLSLTAAEIEADYDKIKGNWESDKPRVRASHILIPVEASDPAAAAAAKKTAELVYAEVIKPGADFAELARTHSSGPSATKGGDIGIFTADRMAEEFSDVAFKLKPGEISKPVKTKFGYHIIKTVGRWPAGALPLDALEVQIRDRLRQKKLFSGRRALKEKLNGDATVVWFMDPDSGVMLADGKPPPTTPLVRPRPSHGEADHEH